MRLPLPAADAEEWRRTDISALDLDAFGVLPHRAEKRRPPASVLALAGDPAQAAGLRLVHDGTEIQSRVAPELARAGLIFCSLPEAVRAYPDLVREHLGTILRDDENKLP